MSGFSWLLNTISKFGHFQEISRSILMQNMLFWKNIPKNQKLKNLKTLWPMFTPYNCSWTCFFMKNRMSRFHPLEHKCFLGEEVDVKLRKISRKLYFMKSKYLKQGVNIEEFVNWSTIQKVFFVLFCYISWLFASFNVKYYIER